MSVPTGRDLTGTYEWKDFSGDTVKSRIYEIRLNNYTAAFQQRQRHIRTFNFNPALNLSENGKPKVSLLRYTSMAQSTIIGLVLSQAFRQVQGCRALCHKRSSR